MVANLEEQDPEINPSKRKKTAGEHLFDRTVYTGVGFGVNEVSSIVITDQFVNGKNLFSNIPGLKTVGKWFSKEGYDAASKKIAEVFKLVDKTSKTGKIITAQERGGNTLLMVTLLSGGTLLILPMKWLEDHKIALVEKANHLIDKWRGTNLTPEEIAERDEEVKKSIACSPRQSWGSMMVGRLVAMCSSVTAGTIVGKERNEKLENWAEKNLTRKGIQTEATRNWRHRYMRLGIIETYSCFISSSVLELISKFTAKRNAQPHDPELCAELSTPKVTPKPADNTGIKETAKDEDCGCKGKDKADGFHATKIQSQKNMAASSLQPAQI